MRCFPIVSCFFVLLAPACDPKPSPENLRYAAIAESSLAEYVAVWSGGGLAGPEVERIAAALSERGPRARRFTESLIALLQGPQPRDLGKIFEVLDDIGRHAYLQLCATDPRTIHSGHRNAVAFWLADGFLSDLMVTSDLPESWRDAIRTAVREEEMLPFRWLERLHSPGIFDVARATFQGHSDLLWELRTVTKWDDRLPTLRSKMDAILVAVSEDTEDAKGVLTEFLDLAGGLSEEFWFGVAARKDRALAEWAIAEHGTATGYDRFLMAWASGACGAHFETADGFELALVDAGRGEATAEDISTLVGALRWSLDAPRAWERNRIVEKVIGFGGRDWVEEIELCAPGGPLARLTALCWIGTDQAFEAVGRFEGLTDDMKRRALRMNSRASESLAAYDLLKRWTAEGVFGSGAESERERQEALNYLMRRNPRLIDIIEKAEAGSG